MAGNLFMPDTGNPASVGGAGIPPFNAMPRPAGSNTPDTGYPNGMGSEGGSIGVISAVNLMEEFHPVTERTVDEPALEYLK